MGILVDAWHAIRSNGETSRSRRTREEVRRFGYDLPRELRRIQDRLYHGYEFGPAFGATPQKRGAKPGKRPLVIAPLPDRIVQRALLDVLQDAPDLPGVQAVLQTPTSIGGIRGRGVDTALELIDDAYAAGARYVAGSDISGFFTKIPRQAVVEFVRQQTDDGEFLDLLERAMIVELKNAGEMAPDDLRMFPTGEDGVAQGCPLSAFAGNVVLREFDSAMNTSGRGIVCIRYIDDFVLLGASAKNVSRAMESAEQRLEELGMSIYDPVQRPDKAFSGRIDEGREFLGYKIVPGIYPPSDKVRDSLLSRLASEFSKGREAIQKAVKGDAIIDRKDCYVQTLSTVDQILRGWIGSFRSSRCASTLAKLDKQVDHFLHDFHGFYRRVTHDHSVRDRRRALGVRLLQDGCEIQTCLD